MQKLVADVRFMLYYPAHWKISGGKLEKAMDKISKLIALVIFSCFLISYGAEYDIKTITTIMDAYEKQIDSIKLKYSYETYVIDKKGNRDFAKGSFAQKKSEGCILLDEIKQKGKRWDNDKEPTGIVRSYNGKVTRYLEHEKNSHDYHMAALYENHNPKLYKTIQNPYYRVWRINYKNKFTDLLNKPNSIAKIQGEELVDGLKTIKINFKSKENFFDGYLWLLPEKNYLPIKFKCYRTTDGSKISEMHWSEFKEFTGGIWYPMNIKLYLGDVNEPVTFKIEEMDISPLTKEDFDFNFPAFTHVTDHILGVSYLITDKPEPPSLVGKALPGFEGINIEFDAEQAKGKRVLVCFFDMQQRPSRHLMRQLAQSEKELKRQDVSVLAVQSSKVDKKRLNKWLEENNLEFPVGMIESNNKKTKFKWGVKALPWLILTDKNHIVTAGGFGIDELSEKINAKDAREARVAKNIRH